jgi:hypothetical protein
MAARLNPSGQLRVGLYVGYLASWLRPIENHAITSGLEVIQAASERARRLYDCGDGGWTVIA